MSDNSRAFLEKYGMLPELVDPLICSDMICEDMKKGLAGEDSYMPMIPTYLVNDGHVPINEPVIVIDAGGTNFRCALLRFTDSGYELEGMKKCLMPGINEPVSWDHFISFVAYVTCDRMQFVKFYPEGNAETRMQFRGRGYLYICCNKHGLMKKKI